MKENLRDSFVLPLVLALVPKRPLYHISQSPGFLDRYLMLLGLRNVLLEIKTSERFLHFILLAFIFFGDDN